MGHARDEMTDRTLQGPDVKRAVENQRVHQELLEMRRAVHDTLRLKLEAAVGHGLLPSDTDTASPALYFVTVLHGLSIQARDGASQEELAAVIDHALTALDWAALLS